MPMNRIYWFAMVALLLLASCSKDKEENPRYEVIPVNKQKLLDLVNEVRTTGCDCGGTYFGPVDSVRWNALLEQAATNHSIDQFLNDTLTHVGSNGSTLADRLLVVGYKYQTAGENVAFGYQTEAAVVQGWIDSPGHCRNIMNGEFEEMGVARVDDYWTQVFGVQQ